MCVIDKIKLLFVCCFIALLSSCQKDDFDQDAINEKSDALKSFEISKGRLVFKDAASFKNFYNQFKEMGNDEKKDFVKQNLYQKHFLSLKPMGILLEDEKFAAEYLSQYKTFKNHNKMVLEEPVTNTDLLENFDDIEDIFGEDTFETFLNHDAEIQIGDDLYKYTDQGLYTAPAIYEGELYAVMESDGSTSLSSVNSLNTTPRRLSFNPRGGTVQRSEHVDHYISVNYIQPDPDGGGGSGGGGGYTGGGPTDPDPLEPLTEQEFNDAVNSLEECGGSKPWLANLFGTTVVCNDRYQDNRRVKTKYYNIDAKLLNSIGVKVKHQKKGWTGLWHKVNTDRLALGVNSVTWKFSTAIARPNNSSIVTNFYTYNGKVYQSIGDYYSAVYVGQDMPVPPLPFADKADIIVEVALSGYTPFTSEYDVRNFFYQNLYNVAKSFVKSDDPSLNKEFNSAAVIINTNYNTYVQYYNFAQDCINCDKLEKNLDWNVYTPKVKYTFGGGEGFNWANVDLSFDMDFNHPDVTGFNIYGMGQAGGIWHGKNIKYGQNL